jgi:hypothetical protein
MTAAPPDICRYRCKQTVAIASALLLICHAVAVNTASGNEDSTIIVEAAEAITFDTLPIRRENMSWFGKRKSRIGDYADVTHDVGTISTRYFERDFKFSLLVVTTQAEKLELTVKNHTVFTPPEEVGLVEDIVDFMIEEKWGISDVEAPLSYKSTYAAKLTMRDAHDDVWEFRTELQWQRGHRAPVSSGTLGNGVRTLFIRSWTEETTLEAIAEIHEDGKLLCTKTFGRAYEFRSDLSPELKLLLLASMEILEINVHGDFSFW